LIYPSGIFPPTIFETRNNDRYNVAPKAQAEIYEVETQESQRRKGHAYAAAVRGRIRSVDMLPAIVHIPATDRNNLTADEFTPGLGSAAQ